MIEKLVIGYLITNYSCNNKCEWCYAAPAGFNKKEMDLTTAKNSLKLMKSVGINFVGLCGGDSTLYSHLFEVLLYAKKLGQKVNIYTNGRKLAENEFVLKLKEAGINRVNFSVQSSSAKFHDEMVQVKGAFNETVKGIENCFQEGIPLTVQTVVCHTKFKIYKEIMDKFSYSDPCYVFYREIPKVNKNLFNAKVLSNKKTVEILRKIGIYAIKKDYTFELFSRMPLCWFDSKDLELFKGKLYAHCHILSGQNLVVDVNGKVLPCPIWVGCHSMNLIKGKKFTSKKEFLRQWNEGSPVKLRKKLLYKPSNNCIDCKFWGKECTAGCPLIPLELPAKNQQQIN
ncbi:MAG: radical SAM protein [Candidatus Diapherotrites archaeon]